MIKSIFKNLFGFHFTTIVGICVGYYIFSIHGENNPLSSFIKSPQLYVIALLFVLSLHFLYWIIIDNSTFYNIKMRLTSFFSDFFFLIISALCTIASLFLIDTFL